MSQIFIVRLTRGASGRGIWLHKTGGQTTDKRLAMRFKSRQMARDYLYLEEQISRRRFSGSEVICLKKHLRRSR